LVTLLLALGLTLASASAGAQQQRAPDEMKRVLAEEAKALKGWVGGVIFNCVITPADLATEPVKQICGEAAVSAGALAGRAKVKFAQVPDARALGAAVARERALGLTVHVTTSDFNQPLGAVVVQIFASRFYVDVVSLAARSGANAAQNPLATPRAATVIFWENSFGASGPPAKLAAGLAPAIEARLKAFFSAVSGTALK
jgi:hypothetical protein